METQILIINKDTIWKAGSDLRLNEEVQIAPGATLTVEEGVTIHGGSITAFGKVDVLGSGSNRVTFNDVVISAGSSNYAKTSVINASSITMNGGSFLDASGGSAYANFKVPDSYFNGTKGFYIWYPYGENIIERSVFKDSYGLSIGVSGLTVAVKDNSFYPSVYTYNENATVVIWANYGNEADISILRNNFLDHGGHNAIALPEGYSGAKLHASQNYFDLPSGVSPHSVVLDRNDSLHRASEVDLKDSRTTANADAPSLKDVNQSPTAIYLSNQAVAENKAGAAVGQVSVVDPDAGDKHSFKVSDDRFQVVNGALKLKAGVSLDHEASATVSVEVTAIDAASLSLSQRFDLAVSDLVDMIEGNDNDDTLFGDLGDDLIRGNGGNDHLFGSSGNDIIFGSDGNDDLNGGFGFDELHGDDGDDTLIGLNGFDTLYGGNGNDALSGNSGNDTLYGDAGEDDLNGGIGFDEMFGGAGNDTLTGLDGRDILSGDTDNDVLKGNAGNDTLYGGNGADILNGGIAADEFYGGADDDLLIGLEGFDILHGDGGADHLQGNSGNDELYGGTGNDTLEGGIGKDLLEGGAGDDYLQTDNGSDTLLGGAGRDTLYGNAGSDRLDGGAGNDMLNGGLGSDTFVFTAGSGQDLIADMGLADQLELDANLFAEATPAAADLAAYATLTEAGLVLDFGNGDVLTLSNMTNLDFLIGASQIA